MSRRVVIAGAGGFGRGVLAWLTTSPGHVARNQIEEIVFIDDGPPAVQTDAPVIATVADYQPHHDDEVLCAVAIPAIRRRIVGALTAKGASFHTFVDDRAVIASNVDIGVGSVVCPGTVISANAQLGSHVHANFNCSIGHDAAIAKFSTLSPAVNVMGEVKIGEDVFIGGSAAILPRITLSRASIIGAGTVVTNDVPIEATVVGNPGRATETGVSR